MKEEWKYQYWLRCIPGIGNKKQRKLVKYCGSAKEVYQQKGQKFLEIPGIGEKDAKNIAESKKRWDLEKEAEALDQKNISLVTLEEESFPAKLRHLPDCPYALFYKGNLPKEQERTAAIVGARMCSSYGRAAALELGEKLASCGFSIISGMAAGIDSFGHWGAIRGRGRTYAVLGCGADVCYPKGGRELYERIQSTGGGLLSEYPPGTVPSAMQFPARNRLISGLSDLVIIVEARKKSGSLITADYALEQGKEIYAVPGRIGDALSEGCNEWIHQGAGIIVSADELLAELGISLEKKERVCNNLNEKIKNPLEKDEMLVYSCFGLYAKNMEELLQMTKIPVQELADLLVRLQAKGWIEEYYKNHYRKK